MSRRAPSHHLVSYLPMEVQVSFALYASLLALILAVSVASDAPLAAEEDSIISTTEEDPPSGSATITITWTTVGGPEERMGGGK